MGNSESSKVHVSIDFNAWRGCSQSTVTRAKDTKAADWRWYGRIKSAYRLIVGHDGCVATRHVAPYLLAEEPISSASRVCVNIACVSWLQEGSSWAFWIVSPGRIISNVNLKVLKVLFIVRCACHIEHEWIELLNEENGVLELCLMHVDA